MLVGLTTLAGCVPASSPPPRVVQVPVRPHPAAPPPVALAPDWRDRLQTSGDWSWRRDPQTGWSEADFGTPQTVAIFCLRSGLVRLAVQYRTGTLTVHTTTLDRTVATTNQQFSPHPHPSATIDFRADDPLLDAMAFSRGRFALEFANEASLYLPSWPEIGRVIEDCR